MIPRVKAAFRYVYRSDKPWKWRIKPGRCPACEGSAFLSFAPSPFHTRCLKCRSTAVNLSIIPVVAAHIGNLFAGRSAYEMSSYGATYTYLLRNFPEMQFSEFNADQPLGESINGIRNEDATRLTFADGSFDVVTSNQVFEHVDDDLKAYSECRRVLKPGGALIFTVPLYDAPQSERIAQLSNGAITWLGAPEFHDSRLGGPQSAPVFWRHSKNDITTRVVSTGFRSAEIVYVSFLKDTTIAQPVIYAIKS